MRLRLSLITTILLLITILPVSATVKYSPGPYYTEDANGHAFSSRHAIDYDSIPGGVYTRNQRLYVNVLNTGDVLDCGFARVTYDSTDNSRYVDWSPLPFTYYNTPYWWYNYYNANHTWVSGQYITYKNETGGDFSCSNNGVAFFGGWSSSINSSYTWSHIHLSW
jgi:hypothetical protein